MKDDLLTRNVENIVVKSAFTKKLASGKKLRIKHGIDPTGNKIHIGRAVVLWKLRELQDLGHTIILIIGDFTATVGDPSDKTAERQPLAVEQVKANMKNYVKQIGLILDLKKTEVRYNSEWFTKLDLADFIRLAEQFTVAQMIERENFAVRLRGNQPVGLHEILYPLLQAYDSVAVKADVEIGGSDQLFNMLSGRDVQKFYGQEPQDVLTTTILEGTDGRKMSTSWGNCIFVTDEPLEMYGKVMSIRDELIIAYFKMATDMPMDQITQIEKDLAQGDNPRDTKASLARHIVARYYGEQAATAAEKSWNKQFREGATPNDLEVYVVDKVYVNDFVKVVVDAFSISNSEVRRKLLEGAVKLNNSVVDVTDKPKVKDGDIIQLGKRRYKKLSLRWHLISWLWPRR